MSYIYSQVHIDSGAVKWALDWCSQGLEFDSQAAPFFYLFFKILKYPKHVDNFCFPSLWYDWKNNEICKQIITSPLIKKSDFKLNNTSMSKRNKQKKKVMAGF